MALLFVENATNYFIKNIPRKRLIDPEFWSDSRLAKLKYRTRLLYIGLWNFADDNGIIENDAEKIKMLVFPYRRVNILADLDDLIALSALIPYEINKKKYLWIKNFCKYQKGIKYPSSRFPLPSTELRHKYGITTGYFTTESRVEKSRVEKSLLERLYPRWTYKK